METLISIIWFFVIFAVLVLSHEFGHFIIARVNGIRVIEFTLGFGPTIFSFKKKGTKFSVKLLPLGGACIFDSELPEGLEGAEVDSQIEAPKEALDSEKPQGIPFREANVWSRIATVLAGPVFNVILAILFSMVIVGKCGSDVPVISGLTEGRPAIESGLEVGDVITKINGEKIHVWRDISLISILNDGEPLTIEYDRNGTKGEVSFSPSYSEEDSRYYIGIEGGATYIECKGFKLFKYSWYELVFNFRQTWKSLESLVMGKLSSDDVAGPVGMAQIVGETYEGTKDYGIGIVVLNMMNLAMLLSVNLGILNLLPIPALDGGRLIFLIVEVFRGKPVSAKKEGIVTLIGVVLLLILMAFVLYNDLSRLFFR